MRPGRGRGARPHGVVPGAGVRRGGGAGPAATAASRAGRRPDGRRGVSALDRLTTLDTSFLWLERPDAPIHVGAVAVFEGRPLLDERGEPRLDELRARVLARLDRLPRLRRRLEIGRAHV